MYSYMSFGNDTQTKLEQNQVFGAAEEVRSRAQCKQLVQINGKFNWGLRGETLSKNTLRQFRDHRPHIASRCRWGIGRVSEVKRRAAMYDTHAA